MRTFALFLCTAASIAVVYSARTIGFKNRCSEDIWVSPRTNPHQGPTLPIIKIARGAQHTYNIPDSGWGGRFWPKTGCDGSGQNCKVGQSEPPCPPKGCTPPSETKVEFFFPRAGASDQTWYDISLVDGYTMAAEIIPSKLGGSCTKTNCALSLGHCPVENEVGDLAWKMDGKTVSCLSPCKKWSYPPPYGLGKHENEGNGKWYCCPAPVTPADCRKNAVIHTKYVALVRRDCPSAYSYSYDDEAGLHNCPNDASYQVNFC